MDYDKWGFWVGLALFVLSIPLSVAVNILTPRLQTWWAERSRASAERRLAELRKRETKLKERTFRQDLGTVVAVTAAAVLASMQCVLIGIYLVLMVSLVNTPARELPDFIPMIPFGLAVLLSWYVSVVVMQRFDSTKLVGLPHTRKQIARLEAFLSSGAAASRNSPEAGQGVGSVSAEGSAR